MSRETSAWLNTNILIGFEEKRGKAWHYKKSDQGREPNHYKGAIPLDDVLRRLFYWQPVEAPVAVLVHIRNESDAAPGAPIIQHEGELYQLSIAVDRKGIIPSDRTDAFACDFLPEDVLGMFKSGYTPHPFAEWLLEEPAKMLSSGLGISSAGLLRNRGQAFVEMSVPENRSVGGFKFRPNLLAVTSLDGTLQTTYSRTITGTVCDNTMSAALAEQGPKIKIRHSKYSKLRHGDAEQALQLITTLADDYEHQARALMDQPVTDDQWERFVMLHFPVKSTAKHAETRLEDKRNELFDLYFSDERVSPWAGTAFGVVQAVNTFETHLTGSRSDMGLGERQVARTVRGDFDAVDNNTLSELTAVFENRDQELVSA